MRITKDQIVAGYPAIKVRDFLRRYRLGEFIAPAAEEAFGVDSENALTTLLDLVNLGFLDSRRPQATERELWFHVTDLGQSFANASAAKPISRQTGNRVLREFMDRVEQVNASVEYIYKIESVVLFGSMLGYGEKLGDVDLAIELLPKEPNDQEFGKMCQLRRRKAEASGRRFGSAFEWAIWPTTEIFLFLKSRSRSLSLHLLSELKGMDGVRYFILQGNPDRLAVLIPAATALPSRGHEFPLGDVGTR